MLLTCQNLEIKCHLLVEFGANGSPGCNFWIMLSNVGHECGKEHGLMPLPPIFFSIYGNILEEISENFDDSAQCARTDLNKKVLT